MLFLLARGGLRVRIEVLVDAVGAPLDHALLEHQFITRDDEDLDGLFGGAGKQRERAKNQDDLFRGHGE